MSTNDTYLAVFLGSKTSPKFAAWNALPEGERRAREQQGMAAWHAWVDKHQGAIVAMVLVDPCMPGGHALLLPGAALAFGQHVPGRKFRARLAAKEDSEIGIVGAHEFPLGFALGCS